MFKPSSAPKLSTVLIASGIIVSLAMGVRHGFGFWLQPMSLQHGWTRETFSLAMAGQNLMWGVFGPLAGIAADRLGAKKIGLVDGHDEALQSRTIFRQEGSLKAVG